MTSILKESKMYLAENDAAAYIGVSVRTLQKWRREGNGPKFVKISSRCVRYSKDTIDEFMKANEVENSQQ